MRRGSGTCITAGGGSGGGGGEEELLSVDGTFRVHPSSVLYIQESEEIVSRKGYNR